ncbi:MULTISPECIES: transketolase [Aneurinibacillus]|uniref:Transketolase n=1 Tax=Aneurinibacillus thermoaerophilus TaxID=143495 RepID=A0A1G7X729_ANETH|nr:MULTISPECIES: transketolase [Aneurinibacillus]AMA73234.1 transketolase [Aneurinibacillus sp. XH2]MED0678356.1 transketolase [Aneurinibacillus thermoaerophilus]MED0736119.1 transketolase [Aneurinibacillus thermoaerophilus]MED0756963.1 transketolase [Aneurinibacillus thermoaerophilus]MED0761732.1 transketolase [Aneurinibacillus thermoaerophilus]
MNNQTLDQLAVNTLRVLSIEAVEKAKSGHPGLPMGAAPMAYTLWTRFMKHNPANPSWANRDRFVLSAGHGSMLLYSLLHLTGYDVSLDDLQNFRQWGSPTPGHPEYGHTPGVEATTGPLGQGIAMAVGMAMTERHLAAKYNRENHNIVDHYTYVLCGDGDLMEGVAAEAISLAGHLKLGRLIVLYDSNDISLDGELSLAFSENVKQRFEACGWHVLRVEDGNDIEAISCAIAKAKNETEHPTLIEIRTTIGYGSPNKAGKSEAHGAPLGAEEIELVRKAYDWEHEPFTVPEEVRAHFLEVKMRGQRAEQEWNEKFAAYKQAHPDLAKQFEQAMRGELPVGWDSELPSFAPEDGKVATREASGQVINVIAKTVPFFLGGSADLASSNKTMIKDEPNFMPGQYEGRNIWFGVREHAMAAIMNGMALHGGVKVYGGTFLVFADYLRPAMRLSALMDVPVIYVFTHDSIAVGEDGPTHEPIEHLPALRAIPNLTVLRPADANETIAAYRYAVSRSKGPIAMILSRQGLPILEGTKEKATESVARGAYILSDTDGTPDLLLIASGSEVSLALSAKQKLETKGRRIRVISMPSWELFEQQPQEYKDKVLPPDVKARVAIEMAHPLGWERYVGDKGKVLGITRFGASAPGTKLMEEYGFTPEHVVAIAEKVIATS